LRTGCRIEYLNLRGGSNRRTRKLNKEEIRNLYSSPNMRMMKSRRMRWAGHTAHMEDTRNAIKMSVGNPEGKILLLRPSHRWKDSISIVKIKIIVKVSLCFN
jgi:hypothetical protein